MSVVRVPLAILAGALLIAASILIVGRYQIDRVAVGAQAVTAVGVDTWTGQPFKRTAPADTRLSIEQMNERIGDRRTD